MSDTRERRDVGTRVAIVLLAVVGFVLVVFIATSLFGGILGGAMTALVVVVLALVGLLRSRR